LAQLFTYIRNAQWVIVCWVACRFGVGHASPIKVLVRPEYLYDFQCDKDAPLVEGIWCSVKSIKGEAFRFETYLPQYGALFDKLPISAFTWSGQIYDALPRKGVPVQPIVRALGQ